MVVATLTGLWLLTGFPASLSSDFSALAQTLWTPASFARLVDEDLRVGECARTIGWPAGLELWVLLPLAILAAGLAQKSFRLVPARLAPDLARIAPRWPIGGWAETLETPARGLFRIVLGGWVAWRLVGSALGPSFTAPLTLEAGGGPGVVASRCLMELAALAALVALGDWLWRRWRFERSIMMSPDEVRLEQRSIEGDPRIKAELESRIESRLVGQDRTSGGSRPSSTSAGGSPGGAAQRRVLLTGGGSALLVTLAADPRTTPIVLAYEEGREAARLSESAARLRVDSVAIDGLSALDGVRVGSTVPPSLFDPLASVHARLFGPRAPGSGRGES
jgi:flagellar biosynthesis protein FlhB